MKNFIINNKKKILAVALLLALIFTWSAVAKKDDSSNNTDKKKVYQVSLLDLSSYKNEAPGVKTSGKVEALQQVELKSEVIAKIYSVNVKLGDQVRAGQSLVVFDNADLYAKLQQAQAGYSQALSQKDQLQAQYDAAVANYNKIKVSADNSVAAAQSALESAKNNLKLNEDSTNSKIVKDAYDNIINELSVVQNLLASSLLTSDGILGIDNPLINDSFEDVLSTKNFYVLNDARNSFLVIKESKDKLDKALNQINSNYSQTSIDQTVLLAQNALNDYKNHFITLAAVLDNTIASGNLTSAQLSTLITSVQTVRSSLASEYASFLAKQQAIVTAKTSLSSYQIAYDKAVRDLKDTKAKVDSDIKSAEASVSQAKASLSTQEAVIKNAQAGINSVNASLSKTIIRTPISGQVSVLPAKTGELISSGQLVASVVNKDALQIKTYVDSDELKKISVGNKVVVAEKYSGQVVNIAPSIDPQTKKIEVIVAIDKQTKNDLVIGQYVDSKIVYKQEENKTTSVWLPLTAVKITTDKKNVLTVDQSNEVEANEVQVDRIRGNEIEVTNGLEKIEKVIATAGDLEAGDKVEIIK